MRQQKLIISFYFLLIFMTNLSAQIGLIVEHNKGTYQLFALYEHGLADGGGTIWGLGGGYSFTDKLELNVTAGSVWTKNSTFTNPDGIESDGFMYEVATTYHLQKETDFPLGLSFEINFRRNSAALSPYTFSFRPILYRTIISKQNRKNFIVQLAPGYMRAKQLLNNQFFLKISGNINIYRANKIYSILPYYSRIFGLCCNQGNVYGLQVNLIYK